MPEAAQTRHRDPGPALQRLVDIVDALRTHCGWTARLTPQTLTPYLVEEAAEVAETVRAGETGQELASELGDVLFQLLLHARLGEERGELDLVDVIDALSAKLLRRNTHVFAADGSVLEDPDPDPAAAERAWQEAKRHERAERGEDPAEQDPLRGLPAGLDSLALAQKALGRAGTGLPDVAASGTDEESIGDRLLGLVAEARAGGVDAEASLRRALRRHL